MEWETVEPKSRPRRSKKQDEYFKVMTEYKTVECKKKHKTIEEQFECFYWHNDKEKRRSPPGLYSANEEDKCHLYDSGKCKDPLCKQWHSKFEQLYHPKKYKGKKCVKEPQNRCPRKSILCAYQHHDDEPIEEWVWREALVFRPQTPHSASVQPVRSASGNSLSTVPHTKNPSSTVTTQYNTSSSALTTVSSSAAALSVVGSSKNDSGSNSRSATVDSENLSSAPLPLSSSSDSSANDTTNISNDSNRKPRLMIPPGFSQPMIGHFTFTQQPVTTTPSPLILPSSSPHQSIWASPSKTANLLHQQSLTEYEHSTLPTGIETNFNYQGLPLSMTFPSSIASKINTTHSNHHNNNNSSSSSSNNNNNNLNTSNNLNILNNSNETPLMNWLRQAQCESLYSILLQLGALPSDVDTLRDLQLSDLDEFKEVKVLEKRRFWRAMQEKFPEQSQANLAGSNGDNHKQDIFKSIL